MGIQHEARSVTAPLQTGNDARSSGLFLQDPDVQASLYEGSSRDAPDVRFAGCVGHQRGVHGVGRDEVGEHANEAFAIDRDFHGRLHENSLLPSPTLEGAPGTS